MILKLKNWQIDEHGIFSDERAFTVPKLLTNLN